MRAALALSVEDTVVGIVAGVLGRHGAKAAAELHAFEDAVDAEAVLAFPASASRSHVIFLADALCGPLQRDEVVASEGLDPTVVVVGSLAQHLFADGSHAVDIAEKVDDLFGTTQQRQVAQDDDTVKAVAYKSEQAAKQPQKRFQRPSSVLVGSTGSSDRGPLEFKISNIFG